MLICMYLKMWQLYWWLLFFQYCKGMYFLKYLQIFFFSLADFFVLIRWYLGYKSKINDGFGAGRDKKRDPLMGLFRIWGRFRIWTGVAGFADLCLAPRPNDLFAFKSVCKSTKIFSFGKIFFAFSSRCVGCVMIIYSLQWLFTAFFLFFLSIFPYFWPCIEWILSTFACKWLIFLMMDRWSVIPILSVSETWCRGRR